VIAGDVRARTALMDELPTAVLERAAEAGETVRTAGASEAPLAAEVDRLVELKATEHLMAAVERFEGERANRGRAAEGIGPVVAALRRAQVDTLLVADRPDGADARLWIGPEPTHLATSPDELRELGVAAPEPDRADAALVRALVATDGHLLVTPPGGFPAESEPAAILRYVDDSTPQRDG
jgi:hypothetical protein